MSEADEAPPDARLRPRRWFSWVWIVPSVAAAIVIGLAIRGLEERGPLITISFTDAEGLQAGDTKIRHKDVDLGTVESLYLNPDMSRVIVRVRMRRSAIPHLTASTRFWIVRPRVGFGGISGLSTLVSGSYIEMYPGDGEAERNFQGLDDPPAIIPDTPGRSFTLRASDLGSLVGGSQISYRGVAVGEVEGFALDREHHQIEIYAFIRAPYESLVHTESRFWNSGGVDVSVGVQGLRFRASSWQQLVSGGISFDTPDDVLQKPASDAGSVFRLYDNQSDAAQEPRGQTLVYRVDFTGPASGGVGPGTSVQLLGSGVGVVTEARLQYDDATDSLLTRVTLQIDPSRVEVVHRRSGAANDPVSAFGARIAKLVARGLRAQLTTASFLTGLKVISLDMVRDAPPAHIEQVDGYAQLPSGSSTDLADILASVKSIVHHVGAATAGPELGHAIKELDRTLTNLDHVTAEVEPQIKPLIDSLRETADAAQHTLQAATNMLGTKASSGTDLPRLIRELTEAARSIRALTDYLDQHPEALLRGRKGDDK
ncbi:MAG TPA: MlaD family protein [Steroidobacteraceae bacterium]|jgi:paraquat-inducible protein B|nr:MlaD family protein [Steroidobacteraceae bacterium]